MNNDTYETGRKLWDLWTSMWNATPALARELCAPGFVLHLPTPTEVDVASITDGAAVEKWVTAHRAKYTSITFSTEVGPFVDTVAGVVAGPWIAEIVIDGKTAIACGMDTIAFRDGKITEYWTISKPADAAGQWARSSTQRGAAK